MFLLEPGHTAFDLHFRIFGVPVRVHPMFWLFSAILGWSWIRVGVEYVLIWVICAFVSILIHELGHVFMALAFGNRSHVVLYTFGGLAIRNRIEPYRWQRIAVSFAGPAAGFLLFGLVWLAVNYGLPRWDPLVDKPLLWATLEMLWFMNLFWNALNLLPIWPLDGGRISQEVCTGLSARNGLRVSLGISFLVAALLAINAIMAQNGRPLLPFLAFAGGVYLAIFFALLAIESFQLLQQAQYGHGEQTPWRRYDPWD
jgi:stage IV sporulation protein FB